MNNNITEYSIQNEGGGGGGGVNELPEKKEGEKKKQIQKLPANIVI